MTYQQKIRQDYINNPNLCKQCKSSILPIDGVKLSDTRKKKFCSRSCAALYLSNSKSIFQNCETCLKSFKAKPSRNRRFCSQKCSLTSISNPLFLRNKNKELCRETRYKQIAHEEIEANKLRDSGYTVYSPTVVCDRIAIKDGKVYFIEFKKAGQKLRPGQQAICDLVSENYITVFS